MALREVFEALKVANTVREVWEGMFGPRVPPNVVRVGDRAHPAAGFEWASVDPRDYSVRWVPGTLWEEKHLVACQEQNQWTTAPGYQWVNPGVPGDLEVRWVPGLRHSWAQHVLAATEPGRWRPENGWRWVSQVRGDLRVEAVAGFRPRAADLQRAKDLATLEVEDGASWSSIEEQFRRLAMLHHPDLFASQGGDAVKAANATFVMLRTAYERLRNAFGGQQ